MFQKCGQKDNKKYTFGLRKEQMEEPLMEKEATMICCASCGTCLTQRMKYCPSCGEKI